MTKQEACELFVAICKDPRTRFREQGIGMARVENLHRYVTIRTDIGDELEICLINYPGGHLIDSHDLLEAEWMPMRMAFDFGMGRREKAKAEDVRKMLGLT